MKLRHVLSEVLGRVCLTTDLCRAITTERYLSLVDRVCLTTDLWKAITTESYISLIDHNIDANWNLKSKIISFCAFPPPPFLSRNCHETD